MGVSLIADVVVYKLSGCFRRPGRISFGPVEGTKSLDIFRGRIYVFITRLLHFDRYLYFSKGISVSFKASKCAYAILLLDISGASIYVCLIANFVKMPVLVLVVSFIKEEIESIIRDIW